MLDQPASEQKTTKVQIAPLEPTLADALVAIEADESLAKTRREAWCCSMRRVAEFLDRDLATLPARLLALRYGIDRLHHAQLGISRKTLQNHLANLKAAVLHVRGLNRLSGRGIALTPIWTDLFDRLPSSHLRFGLSGFARYCSATGIDPIAVSDETVDAFIGYAREIQFTVKPRDLHKQITRAWNQAKETVARWPQITLRVPDFRAKPTSLRWDAFSPNFGHLPGSAERLRDRSRSHVHDR